jgi:hypothetical protein
MSGNRNQSDEGILATESKQDSIIDILKEIEDTTSFYTVRIVESGGYTYIGKAVAGSLQSATKWQVSRIDESSGMIMLFADGDTNFDNVWNNYATLTYS